MTKYFSSVKDVVLLCVMIIWWVKDERESTHEVLHGSVWQLIFMMWMFLMAIYSIKLILLQWTQCMVNILENTWLILG